VYNLFKRVSYDISDEEQSSIELLRTTHERVLKRAKHVTHDLVRCQSMFLERFQHERELFRLDVDQFVDDYDQHGPMVDDLPAQEASERLTRFELRFIDLWKRYETCTSSEHLFGLIPTEYSHLQIIRKQLNYLKRLYGLYNHVLATINIYASTQWHELRIEQINNEIQEFQSILFAFQSMSNDVLLSVDVLLVYFTLNRPNEKVAERLENLASLQ
jgi:dynein heavy chain, axonemal